MNMPVAQEEIVLGAQSAGLLMTPEEFDAIEEYDENYRYELVKGVLVVLPFPLTEETGANEALGYLLYQYRERHPLGKSLDHSMREQYVRSRTGRRLADRVIWAGLDRRPKIDVDLPTIAIEFVCRGKRDRQRDYVDKRAEYLEVGIKEYWIIDRFQRTMTVIRNKPTGVEEPVVAENQTYESALLPGFVVPLGRILEAADQWAEN